MLPRTLLIAGVTAFMLAATGLAPAKAAKLSGDGLVRLESKNSVDETVARAKSKVALLGVMLFNDIDQAALAKGAGTTLNPSHLILFGNPPLGIQFLTAEPFSGIDWPVRMLVLQDSAGKVWIAYTDFAWIAKRHGIKNRDAQLKMASAVAGMIAAYAAGP